MFNCNANGRKGENHKSVVNFVCDIKCLQNEIITPGSSCLLLAKWVIFFIL